MSKLTQYDIEFEDFCREEQVSWERGFREDYKIWLGGEQPTVENLIEFTEIFKQRLAAEQGQERSESCALKLN